MNNFQYVAKTVFVDSVHGVNAIGRVERSDLPFLTIAAARTALLAYWTGATAASATNRIKVIVTGGTFTESITLDNYVDYELNSIVLNQTSAGSLILDNGVAVNSVISGNANLTSTTTGGAATYGINISHASSVVSINFNNLTMNGTASTLLRGVRAVGTLTVNFNNISVTDTTANTIGIYADAGIIFATARGNVTTTATGLQNAMTSIGVGAKLYFNGNDVTASGTTSTAMATISAQTGGKAYIRCNNIYHTASGASVAESGAILVALSDSPELYVKCNEIIVTCAASNSVTCCQVGRDSSAQTVGGIMVVDCYQATIAAEGASNVAIAMEDCDANTKAIFKGRYVVTDGGGTNVSCVSNKTGTGSLGKLTLDNATLIAIGTGNSITANAAANVFIHGVCQANLAVHANVTEKVGVVIVDSNVS